MYGNILSFEGMIMTVCFVTNKQAFRHFNFKHRQSHSLTQHIPRRLSEYILK